MKRGLQTMDNRNRMELLFKKFYHRLYLYALTFLNDEDESADVVCGVFQTVWEDWNSDESNYFEPTSSFFYTTVRNRCLDLLRHSKAVAKYEEMLKATESLVTDESVNAFEQRVLRLHQAILELPEPGQTVLRCVYFKRLSYKETAEHLGMSVNMVHKHMLKVFRLLKGNMSRFLDVLLFSLILL